MVKANYTVEEKTHTLTVTGHANFAEYGKDIVCAGISSLVQALIGWIEENFQKDACVIVDPENGKVVVACEGGDDVAAVFYMASIGLAQIADSYPDHMQIDIVGIAD